MLDLRFNCVSGKTVGILAGILLIFQWISVAESVGCFECSSLNDTYCPEFMTSDDGSIVPYNDCSHVYKSAYCIKTTGVTGGSLGTRRFCSSTDMGNYCEYIRRPGDPREYRSCVFTCSSDSCNPAVSTIHSSISPAALFLLFTGLTLLLPFGVTPMTRLSSFQHDGQPHGD